MPTLALLQVRSLLTLVQVNTCAPIAIGSRRYVTVRLVTSYGDDSSLVCLQEGTIELPVKTEKATYKLSLTNALLAPQLRHTLISCSALSSSGISTYFAGPYCSLYDTSSPGAPLLVARCTEKDGLYCLPSPVQSSANVAAQLRDVRSDASLSPQAHSLTANNPVGDTSDVQTWNRRLGHTGVDKVRDMIRRGMLPSVTKVRPHARIAWLASSTVIHSRARSQTRRSRVTSSTQMLSDPCRHPTQDSVTSSLSSMSSRVT